MGARLMHTACRGVRYLCTCSQSDPGSKQLSTNPPSVCGLHVLDSSKLYMRSPSFKLQCRCASCLVDAYCLHMSLLLVHMFAEWLGALHKSMGCVRFAYFRSSFVTR